MGCNLKTAKSHSLTGLATALLGAGDGAADVGENSSFSDGGVVQQLVELLVVSDGEKDVSGDDP